MFEVKDLEEKVFEIITKYKNKPNLIPEIKIEKNPFSKNQFIWISIFQKYKKIEIPFAVIIEISELFNVSYNQVCVENCGNIINYHGNIVNYHYKDDVNENCDELYQIILNLPEKIKIKWPKNSEKP